MTVERDHMGREFTSGAAHDNAGVPYAPAVDGEPLERARRRAAGVVTASSPGGSTSQNSNTIGAVA